MSYISTVKIKDQIVVWERNNPRERDLVTYPAPYSFYTEDPNGDHTSIYGKKLQFHQFNDVQQFNIERSKIRNSGGKVYESDIAPELKVLSQQYYNQPAPTLNVSFLDIEVDYNPEIGFASALNPYAPINSIAIHHMWINKTIVIAVPPPGQNWTEQQLIDEINNREPLPSDTDNEIILVKNEKELLVLMLDLIENSDVLCGWNSDFFDMPYICKRLEKLGKKYLRMMSFQYGNLPKFREEEVMGNINLTVDLSGRISADYMVLFKKYEMEGRPTYKLEAIAEEFMPELPKLEYEGSLAELYVKDFAWFVRYNFRDTEILLGLEQKLGYVDLANQMMHISTGVWKHVTGTLKLAELATINYCHHELNLVVPDNEVDDDDQSIEGAYVLLPQVGMHEAIGSIDIASLYPSSIRSINISPEKIIGQFELTERAVDLIHKQSDQLLTLMLENGKCVEMSAREWRQMLKDNKWAISGYGTVFDQNEQGIIPAILESWFTTRKKYKKMCAVANMEAEKILDKYK